MYSQHTIGMPSTPTRKRKRPAQVSYSEVQEVDALGRLKNVIVIEDTPPPTASATASTSIINGIAGSMSNYIPPIRTRAQAAAAKAALSHVNNGAGSSTSSFVAPPVKKRKREYPDEPGTSNGVYAKKANLGNAAKPWPTGSGAVTEVSPLLSKRYQYSSSNSYLVPFITDFQPGSLM